MHQQGQQGWVREILDRKILLQYPAPVELQEKYWRAPNKENGLKVMQYFYDEMKNAGRRN